MRHEEDFKIGDENIIIYRHQWRNFGKKKMESMNTKVKNNIPMNVKIADQTGLGYNLTMRDISQI